MFFFHIESMERAKRVFNIVDLCGADVYVKNNNNNHNNKIRYYCCGKVIIRNLDSETEIGGYILEETITWWKVHLANNRVVYIPCPIYNAYTNNWICPTPLNINTVPHNILEYSHIRMLIS